ncbi:MAG: hypothetical protein WC911_05395 [Thermoleophilia bacterium]
MRRTSIAMILTAAILAWPLLMESGCGGDASETGSVSTASGNPNAVSPEDRAARLAAQNNLRNAQMAQESYYAENERYASSASELQTMDPRLNSKIQVINGSGSGFEMSIEASDSAKTVYIIRRSNSKVERVDGNGNSW